MELACYLSILNLEFKSVKDFRINLYQPTVRRLYVISVDGKLAIAGNYEHD